MISVLLVPVCASAEPLLPVGGRGLWRRVQGVASPPHIVGYLHCTVIDVGSVFPVNPHLGRIRCMEAVFP